jgi:hypothetical protein
VSLPCPLCADRRRAGGVVGSGSVRAGRLLRAGRGNQSTEQPRRMSTAYARRASCARCAAAPLARLAVSWGRGAPPYPLDKSCRIWYNFLQVVLVPYDRQRTAYQIGNLLPIRSAICCLSDRQLLPIRSAIITYQIGNYYRSYYYTRYYQIYQMPAARAERRRNNEKTALLSASGCCN